MHHRRRHCLRKLPTSRHLGALAACLGLLAGCGGDPHGDLSLRVVGGDGARPAQLVVVARRDGALLERLSCEKAANAGSWMRCTAQGLILRGEAGKVSLLLKARGHRYAEQVVEASHGGDLTVTLQALPAPVQNADFATSMGAEQEALYLSMAVSADTDLGPTHVVKFYIADGKQGPEVYFQNTRKHMLHFNFAKAAVGVPGTLTQFEQATYHGDPREAFAGTLMWVPTVSVKSAFAGVGGQGAEATGPILLTFMPGDDLTAQQALRVHRLIEERLGIAALDGGAQRLMYLPAGDLQQQALDAARADFERGDAAWIGRQELYAHTGMQLLNPGVAFGRLQVLTPESLAKTVVSYTDVLVLPRLPNELPIVGGTISEELQTPLAHVNVAARTRGTPNMALPGATSDPRVAPLVGKMVRFEVGKGGFELREATLQEAQAFWQQQKKPLFSPPHDDSDHGLPHFGDIGFSAASFTGVKAANLAELHQLLKDGAPKGFAVPFHHYDAFMAAGLVTAQGCEAARQDCLQEARAAQTCAQAHALCLPGGATETLWQHVDRMLADPTFAADAVLREASLDSLRHLMGHIEVDPAFATALDARVAEVFGNDKVRLRSSTNAEDLEDFSGAGLYSSYGAWATGAQRASSRVRKVWASVWSQAAFEERGFWNIAHRAVRMGVAVSQAYVDEAANGVLITRNLADPFVVGMYVNLQLGEVAVTNPEGGAVPEVFSIVPSPAGGVQVARLRFSSLSPGKAVMSDLEVYKLFVAASKVQQRFADLYGVDPSGLTLDMEFKLTGAERALVVKQVRPYSEAGP